MSDDKVSLDFLGEQMRRMQTDLRGVRTDLTRLETEVHGLDDKIVSVDAKVDLIDAKVDRVDAKVDALDAKLGNFMSSVDARFDQVHETMTTNFEIVVRALDAKRS